MKKIFKLLLAFTAISAMTVSCVDEINHQPGEPDLDGCYGVYFPTQDALGAHTFDPTMPTSTEFTVARLNSKGEITVPLEITDPNDVYEVGELVFADGQKEATLTVDFPKAEIGKVYPLTLSITDPQYVSNYTSSAVNADFSVMRVEWKYFLDPTTKEPAIFDYIEGWNGYGGTCKLKYYEVNGVRTCVVEPETYVEEGTPYTQAGFWGSGEKYQMTFTWYTDVKVPAKDGETMCEAIHPDCQVVDHHNSYGADVLWADSYSLFTVINPQAALDGVSFQEFAKKYAAQHVCGYYDGNGSFYFYTRYYYMLGVGGWSVDAYDVVLESRGFSRVDYTLNAETDFPAAGKQPVYFASGADVAEIKFVAAEGELTATQIGKLVEKIEDGTAENIQSVTTFELDEEDGLNYSAVELSFAKTGAYTVVAVAFDDKAKAQANTSLVLNYVAAADEKAHAVKLTVGTEATSARYAADSLDAKNSFGYYLVGKDLTEVHVATVAAAKYDADPKAFDAAIKDLDPVSDSLLAMINGKGGYATVVGGLSAYTKYYVLAWATNGELETIQKAEWTTDGLPNVVIDAAGQFGYAGLFAGYDEEKGETYVDYYNQNLEFNPNIDMYEIPDAFYGISFKFSWDKKTNAIDVPVQYTGYTSSTSGSWYVGSPANFTADGTEGYYPYDWVAYGTSKGQDMSQPSLYDPETKTFKFYLLYVSSGSYVNWPEYHFYVTSESAKLTSQSAAPRNLFSGHATGIVYERDARTVGMQSRSIAPSFDRTKTSVKDNAPERAKFDIKF